MSVLSNRTVKISAALVGAFLFAAASVTPAIAAPTDPNQDARDFLTTYGVDSATQDRLIQEYMDGGRWESFSSDSVPLRTESSETDGYLISVSRYEDGSVAVTRVELPRESADPSIASSPNGCTVSGNNRNNCNVDMWVGVVSLAFKASYNVASNTVSNVYGASWSIGGACSTSQLYLGTPAANIGRLDVSAQMCVAPYNTTFFLQLTVSGGVATESWN